ARGRDALGRPSRGGQRALCPGPRALPRVRDGGRGQTSRRSGAVPALPRETCLWGRGARRLRAHHRAGQAGGPEDDPVMSGSGRTGGQGPETPPGARSIDRTTLARLLACVLARELRDGEVVAFGLNAELLL